MDHLAGTKDSKRKWRQRNNRRRTEKVLLPAKRDSSDEENCDDSETVDVSVDNECDDPNNVAEDFGSYSERDASPIRSCDLHIDNKAGVPTVHCVYSPVGKTASSPSHNSTHGRTAKVGHSTNETLPAKDGQTSGQEIGMALRKQIHTHYVSVERLPEIQVNKVLHFC